MAVVSNLSVVILTKNAQNTIQRCLQSVQFCGETIVIDDGSTDNTPDMARQLGAEVHVHSLDGDFAQQRNYGMSLVKGDWVLYIDADEEVTPKLQQEIVYLFANASQQSQHNHYVAYHLKRRDYWWGKEIKFGDVMNARNPGIIRLVQKGKGLWKNAVHEIFAASGQVGQLRSYINHYPHPSVATFLEEVNLYSRLRAQELWKKGERSNVLQILSFPLAKFVWNYLIKLGFLDGASGFAYAFFMSFHSFLVRSKLYVIGKSKTE